MIKENKFFKGQKIILFNGVINIKAIVRKVKPMRYWDKENSEWMPIHDYEIVIDKKNNKYFSLNMLNEGTSWVKSLEFVNPTTKEVSDD